MSEPESHLIEASEKLPPIQFLVVEDTPFVRESIVETLSRKGHKVLEADSGAAALVQLANEPIDFILLDIILPDTDGFELCKTIRETSNIPIVMLTALFHTDDILRGFDVGADDYITKPFSATELLYRIVAILRRAGSFDVKLNGRALTVGDLTLDQTNGVAQVAERSSELSPIEARLLRYLMERPDRSIQKEELFKEVWGYELAGGTNLVEVAVRRLRTKIEENPSQPTRILTVHGFGYRFSEQPGAEAGPETAPEETQQSHLGTNGL